MLDELARVTAEGFGTAAPDWTGKRFDIRLGEYARFTAREAGLLVAAGDDSATEAAKERLRVGATRLWGLRCAETLGVRAPGRGVRRSEAALPPDRDRGRRRARRAGSPWPVLLRRATTASRCAE